MNCETELIEDNLKKDFPYVVKIKTIVEKPFVPNPSEIVDGHSSYLIDLYIKQSFFDQLENNNQLKNIIFESFTKECIQIIKNICPEMDIISDKNGTNLVVKFLPYTE